MGYKRFNIGIPALSENGQCAEEVAFVSTVSPLEIGKSDSSIGNTKTAAKKERGKMLSFATRVITASIFLAIILSVIPLPKKLESILLMTAKTVTDFETVKKAETTAPVYTNPALPITIPEDINTQETKSEEEIIQPSIESVYDFSQSIYSEISNETKYGIDVESVLSESYPIDALTVSANRDNGAITVFSDSNPEVLIIHTHGTECYADSGTENFRTDNTEENVVRVGRAFYERLSQNGVSAIHLEDMFDRISYIKAYSNSYSAVNEYLKKYPSIKYVIDIHRDAVCNANGVYEPMLFGQDTARMMFVVGTDEAGSGHTEWKKNLRTALGLQYAVSSEYPGIMRNLNLRRASFNQQLCPGYFILEVGNCGNTLEQAVKAAEIFADVFAETV